MIDEDRLIDIEIKLARQEDLVETLNDLVYRQQKQIDGLQALCDALTRHVKDLASAANAGPGGAPAHEIPPHY